MHRALLPLTLLFALCAPGCPGAADDDDASNDDDVAGDDDDAAACAQAATILDVTNAPGAGAGYPAPELAASCQGGELVVTGNGIPTYMFVSTTPNPLQETQHEYRITLTPQLAGQPTAIPLLGLAGFAVNGMPWFGPNEGPMPDPYGDPIYNGIVDGCSGHTAAEYHNHALVQKCLTQEGAASSTPWTLPDPDPTTPSPIIGWALDGFPIYGPYGCLDSSCAEVAEMKSSWEQTGDPSTYAWDNHAYVERDEPEYLDPCNGRVQPDGTYGYHATATFPYILGCYAGTVDGGGGPGDDDDDDGPTPCDDPSDCVDECPLGSLGCTCADAPNGAGGVCVPTCVVDADCEDLVGGPPGGFTCEENLGICVPANGGPPM
jgi:hypothetical protein